MNAPGLTNQVSSVQPFLSSWIDRLATTAAYLYLRRVPILIGAFIFVLPFVALWPKSPLTSLFQNLFMLGMAASFWCAIAVAVLSWSLLLTGRLVLINGKERFNTPQLAVAENLSGRSLLTVLLVALPLILGPFTQRHDFGYTTGDLVKNGLSALAGLAAAYVLAFFALFVAVLGAAKGTQAAAVTFPGPKFLRGWLAWADQHVGLAEDFRLEIGSWVRRRLPRTLWEGYLDHKGFLLGGQWLALVFFFLTMVLYKVVDVYAEANLGGKYAVPALTFVILLLINVNWLFSALAFFLDRYRIPLLVPILAFCLLSGALFPSLSDHYYTTIPTAATPVPVTPAQVVEERMKQRKPIVVIVTAGGGIQSAAWTDQVMLGLEKQTEEWGTMKFSDSVTLMSGASGGANGEMFYLNLYRHQPGQSPAFDREGLNHLVETASADSLDSVAWALVYRDIPRVLFPYLNVSDTAKLRDRGYMLEQAWRKHGDVQGNLSQWREGVAAGLRPAAIFNSAIDETGEPLVLATTDMKDTAPDSRGFCNMAKETTADRRSFHGLYPKTDLPVVTAVRLASTFPYVTPAARALSPCPEYHMIDGGYYDNYGVSSAIAWLEEAFLELHKQGKPLPEDVLFVQIRSFPDDALAEPASKGWFFQAYAPLNGLLSVRTTAQLVRDREELEMFAQRWRKSPEAPGRKYARIHFAGFEFLGQNPPLSWSMNPRQKAEIGEQWKSAKTSMSTDMLEVRCLFQPTNDCGNLGDKGPW
jgi:hypothetical protein